MALTRIFISNDAEHLAYLQTELDKDPSKPMVLLQADATVKKFFWEWLDKQDNVAIDIETTHFDPYMGDILLTSFYAGDKVVTFDNKSTHPVTMFGPNSQSLKATAVAHNLKFESLWFMKYGIEFKKGFCTMLAEQKLLQGSDLKNDIISVLTRRHIELPEDMDKAIREEFTNGSYTKPELRHIFYNQGDVLPLLQLQKQQQVLINSSGLDFFLNQIHFPLIRTLCLAEMEGMVIDEPKFIGLADVAEKKMLDIASQLETWIRAEFPQVKIEDYNKPVATHINDLKNRINRIEQRIIKNTAVQANLEAKGKTHLKSYELVSNSIVKAENEIVSVAMKIEELEKITSISWTAGKQVIELLTVLGCTPLPKTKDKKTKKFKPSLAKAARERWLLQNQNHKFNPVIRLYDQYMQQTKHVNSFGRSFLTKYKHPHTGRYHTLYKQGTVETGRLASGNSDSKPAKFNSQQLPSMIRECFMTEEGYDIATVDLSGAELITMCSLAQDHRLLELSKTTDLHSYFANLGWEAIYKARGIPWTEKDHISKDQNAKKRKAYKPMLFGTVYGLRAPKAAETLNISEQEGQIALNTIIKEIPATIKMVESASKFAIKNGYIIHNTRTNSRRWFPAVVNAKNSGEELGFMDRSTVESQARNTRIQGSQADMLCEAMVFLQRYIDLYKLDAKILMQVHDELVVKYRSEYGATFPEKIKSIMIRTANKYLIGGVQMDAEMKFGKTWCK